MVSNFDNVAHPKFRVGVPFMCSAKSLISSDDKKYGGSGAVKRTAHKVVKADWDERNYAVDLEIPAMSTTIYQLTPCAEPAPKATEAKKVATKKTAAKKTVTKKAGSEEKAALVSPKKTNRKKTTVPKQMTEAKAAAAQAVEAAKADPKKPAAKSTGTKASAQRKSVQKAVLDQKLTKRRKG